jgi:selenocysteine lyase/cysteine desulfurase
MTFAASHLQAAETSRFPAFNGGLRDLFSTLDDLLTCGGDPRLMLDPVSRLNDYGCGPSPLPQTLSFASSTASTISERAYERAGLAREELMRSAIAVGLESALETRIEDMRAELKAYLALPPEKIDVVFSASGTDSQLHALYLARLLLGPDLKTIVVGSDQTGSGTPFTARGRHFNRFTASGMTVRKDTPVAGLVCDSVMVPIADASGVKPRADADLAVLDAVEAAVADGSRVLLHVMDASKFGWRAPSQGCLDAIAQHWGDKVLLVVDACQMRLGRRRLRFLLDRGCMVLVTGSKFFGGPAFSGALLVPSSLSTALDGSQEFAQGISDYANRSDWPMAWSKLRSRFESRSNLGQWLRWEAALEEIGAYYEVPDTFRAKALRDYRIGIESLLSLSPSLQPVDAAGATDDEEFSEATIFPFTLHHNGRALSVHDCRMLHGALAEDLGGVIDGSEADRDLVARRCLIGQPVRIERLKAPTAALRLCVGARLVTEAWSPDAKVARQNLQEQLDGIAEIVAKIECLLALDGRTGMRGMSRGL